MSSLAAEVRKSWMVPNGPRWYEPQISPMETGSVIQARVERWMGWDGGGAAAGWPSLMGGKRLSSLSDVRLNRLESHCLTSLL